MDGEFSTYWFYGEDHHRECYMVDAETAVQAAARGVRSVAGQTGILTRVIITDGGDSINFEWLYGKGVVFPKHDNISE